MNLNSPDPSVVPYRLLPANLITTDLPAGEPIFEVILAVTGTTGPAGKECVLLDWGIRLILISFETHAVLASFST